MKRILCNEDLYLKVIITQLQGTLLNNINNFQREFTGIFSIQH